MPHYRFAAFALAFAGLLLGGLCTVSAVAQARSGAASGSVAGAGAGASGTAGAPANSPTHSVAAAGKAPLLLQRIDDTLYGVDMLSLAVVDRHHVSGILVRVNAARPHPPLDYSHFVVDCQGQMRVAQLASAVSPFDLTSTGASARARLQAATQFIQAADSPAPPRPSPFKPLATLNGSRALAEFTCAAMQRPAQAAPLAKDVYDNGGPRDLRTALCDLQPDGASVTREDVTVRFSDSEKVVAVNQQWLTSGQVTDAEISFGSGSARWRIDRTTAEANLVDANGKVLFAGSCAAVQTR